MPLNKQVLNINFAQGLDNKTDKFQVQPGKFLTLSNTVFDTLGQLTKRNGFDFLPTLPTSDSQFLTTFNNNLTAIGQSLYAFSEDTSTWIGKGSLLPVSLSTLPLIRSNLNQSQVDTSIASNGLVCTVYTDNLDSASLYKYAIADSVTGQNVVSPTLIPPSAGTVSGSPRVFLLGNYFVVVFTTLISATSHLQYIAISTSSPTNVTAAVDIATSYAPSTLLSWDGVVANSNLYIGYNTLSGGQSLVLTYIGPTLGNSVLPVTFTGQKATIMSLAADVTFPSAPVIYMSWYDSTSSTGNVIAVDKNLNILMTSTQIIASGTVNNLTSVAANGVVTEYYEVFNTISQLANAQTDFINTISVTLPATIGAGTPSSTTVFIRSLGLASKAVLYNGIPYLVGVQSSAYQPTYFLLNGFGNVISRLAYSNGGGYLLAGLPNITVTGNLLQFAYLFKDLISAVNKGTNLPSGTQVAGVYSQTGINLASYNFKPKQTVAEIGANLNISGGVIASYDGYSLVENGFWIWPENVTVETITTGGDIVAGTYSYQVTYEWCDNQGNIIRSAPSIPFTVITAGSTSTNFIFVPTLRTTYRIANPVKIVIYRWSVAQQNYYQVTSVALPFLNDPTVDYITFTDTLSDAEILGNSLIYTTGGVIENIAPPASDVLNLFNNRMWLIDAEDRNLLWYSKQVIEATPVEMSDLLTLYVAPTTGVQGSTGPMYCLASMDDKQIIFKANAAYYINGIGPDNTGANSQYSDPIYITSSVGCMNPQSIALIPNGLMFQSNKGIWLLGRDLSTVYIGAPVEALTKNALATSVVSVPGTNQVRFSMDSGITLVYDYFVGQWATFTNNQLSSVIYNGLHTYINKLGQCFQETPGQYLDGGTPVLLSFQTGWMNLAGQQGFERFYESLLLGTYYTPFKLNVQYSFDFELSPSQATMVSPSNYVAPWGGEQLWGSGQAWGGPGNAFKARIFPIKQKCESFQVTVSEIYDPSFGVQAGAGLTLTGLSVVAGVKRGFRTQSANKSFG